MTPTDQLAPRVAAVPASAVREKRLGQYFSGPRVAALLAALAGVRAGDNVCDPMAGSGDMLVAALPYAPAAVVAIEIDPIAQATCAARLAEAPLRSTLVRGNAFVEAVAVTPSDGFDVVITNPPYVRYQSASHATDLGVRVPSATEIRGQLRERLHEMPGLSAATRELFLEHASGYSGLSDLAVPSWLLCAAMTKAGGTLAMVMPETWLSRNYARPIRELLGAAFEPAIVVEDANGTWFESALVRTALVVARRRKTIRPAAATLNRTVRLRAEAGDHRSLVGAAYAECAEPDAAFSRDLLPSGDADGRRTRVGVDVAPDVRTRSARARACPRLPGDVPRASPMALFRALGDLVDPSMTTTLASVGWTCGQGLRTGANAFFYLHVEREDERTTRVRSSLFPDSAFEVPHTALRPVLRRQVDLAGVSTVAARELRGRVLVLDGLALPEDLRDAARAVPHLREALREAFAPMPEGLAGYVRHAATTSAPGHPNGTPIPQLTAVAPNARWPGRRNSLPRWWYVLPPLTTRHVPPLLIPRVNGGPVRAFVNPERVVVDANFATLWPVGSSEIDEHTLLAIMSSTWVEAALEVGASVMGGGALKVEAAHMRSLPLPVLAPAARRLLGALGRDLSMVSDEQRPLVRRRVDDALARALVGSDPQPLLARLAAIASRRQADRGCRRA